MKHIFKALILLVAIGGVSACVTQKKKDDVSKLGKFYHNTTAKFNGYFNANVLLTESIAKLDEQHQDNYNQILEIYPYTAADNPQAVASDLDEAIKKVSIVVSLHRVSHWTDDCYLLMGQAQYLKKNYEDAEETFKFFREEFDPETADLRAKKGKRSRKKTSRSRGKSPKKSAETKKKEKDKKKKKKAREKERKKYNKQLKKKRKKKKSSRKRSSSKSDKGKKDKEITKPSASRKNEKKKEGPDAKKKEDKKKDKDDKNEDGKLKHRPVYQDGLLWLARTFIERENYFESELILNKLARDPKIHEPVARQLPVVQAYFQMKQKRYEQVIPYLETAIKRSKERDEKARYSYIIGQIHQMGGRSEAAAASFKDALKYSTSYEMEFSSKLNLIKNDWNNGRTTGEATIAKLIKMTKDIKNDEYQDQLYYAMSQIALKENDKLAAIGYLKKSLLMSKSNRAQKAESYLQLADLYFESQQFVDARNYYDSTLLALTKTDERYGPISRKKDNLEDIAKNLVIIQVQDSLLNLSKMSDKDRKALAYKIKKDEEEAKLKRLTDNARNSSNANQGRRSPVRPSSSPSTFFAYNEKGAKKGSKDFERRWGQRVLEDNWRRSNRRNTSDLLDIAQDDEQISRELTEDDINKILKDIPSSDSQIKATEGKIADALFALGRLYRERLEYNEKTVESLEELLRRFPDTKHRMDAYYYLYLAHTDLGQAARAREYYDKLVSDFPGSTYARVLQDPNFMEASKEEERRLTAYYDDTYAVFRKGEYKQAIERTARVNELFGPNNALRAKFALLSAMSLGNVKGKDAYVAALRDVAAKFPNTDEQKRAKEILRLLSTNAADDGKVRQGAGGRFKIEEKAVHYFIVMLKNKSVKLSDAKNSVSDFNRKYHKLDRLRISNIYLGSDTSTPILVIRRFKGKSKAMAYYDGIKKNERDFLPVGAKYEIYPVTQYNYRQILKAKSMDGYDTFFQDNYEN
ncbi:MAG: tetratricopeptide repeat protein [Bacteroidota bacterium]